MEIRVEYIYAPNYIIPVIPPISKKLMLALQTFIKGNFFAEFNGYPIKVCRCYWVTEGLTGVQTKVVCP